MGNKNIGGAILDDLKALPKKILKPYYKNGKLNANKVAIDGIPFVIIFYVINKYVRAAVSADGGDMLDKCVKAFSLIFQVKPYFAPSFKLTPLICGIGAGVAFKLFMNSRKKNAKQFRPREEYGSAKWGTDKDFEPYTDPVKWNNIPLTATEWLRMTRPEHPKYDRNKNILIVGGSGAGKTRGFVKPSLMQMQCSYVVTDPKGTVLEDVGTMLARGAWELDDKGNKVPKVGKNGQALKTKSDKAIYKRTPYKIKVFNTINFAKSMHYNPFAYIHTEQDVLKFVNTLIANTKGEGAQSGEDFWVKAERLLFTAYVAYIVKYCKKSERNFVSLLAMIDGINGCSKWDNDVGRGEKPILIEAVNLEDDFIKNTRTKGDMEYGEHEQSDRGSKEELRFSGNRAGDRGADAQSGNRDPGAHGRDGEHDTGRAVLVSEEDLRQVSGISHSELFDENIPEVYEGEMPELFARQILAMTTGCDMDGSVLADAGEHKFRPEYAVETYNDNPDDYAEVAKGVTFTTVYGDVQLDSVSQYDVGRFNLTEEQFTGTLLEGKDGLDKGQKIVFEKEDIMAVNVDYRDIDVRADTSLMNEAYEDRKTEMENPEHDRTYRCYVDGDKSAFDICLFKDDDGKKHFYIEDTADYPLITGELPKETEFIPGTAVSLMNDMGECYDGSREFILYDVHMPERTEELMDKSRKEELFPTALFVSEIREHGTSIHRYDCCDDFNAKAFGESLKDRNEEHGIRTMVSVAMKKQPEKVHEVSKSQQDVVEAFRAKTRDLFHELDGQNAESIESMVRGHVEDALQTFDIDAQVVDVVLVGSRCRGIEHEDSDVDVVVEYYGSEREDSLFNILNEEGLSIGGRNIDINPITKDRSGTLETYLP